jgi:hypothetical protein
MTTDGKGEGLYGLAPYNAIPHSPLYDKAIGHLIEIAGSPDNPIIPRVHIPGMIRFLINKALDDEIGVPESIARTDGYDFEDEFGRYDFSDEDFARHVSSIDVTDCVEPLPGRQLGDLSDYSLVPVVSTRSFSSESPAGYDTKIHGEATQKAKFFEDKMYMDSGMAIGLAYKGHIRGLAGAYIDRKKGQPTLIRIVQLQSVVADLKDKKAIYKESGLYGGFHWRVALVKAWKEVAPKLGGDTLSMISASNHYWVSTHDDHGNYLQLLKGYDGVAVDMGFMYDQATGDWSTPVEDQP